jgi:hypothetical protein
MREKRLHAPLVPARATDFMSGEYRRGARLGEADCAGARPQEVGARRRLAVGFRWPFGQGGRGRFEQRRLRCKLAERAAGVATARQAIMCRRRRSVVAFGAENGGRAERRFEFRRDDGNVVALLKMMIGQRGELGENRDRGE